MHTCMNSYIKTSPPIITSTTEKRENDIHSFNPDISIAPPKSTTTQRRSRPQQLTVSEFTRRSTTGNRIQYIQYIISVRIAGGLGVQPPTSSCQPPTSGQNSTPGGRVSTPHLGFAEVGMLLDSHFLLIMQFLKYSTA